MRRDRRRDPPFMRLVLVLALFFVGKEEAAMASDLEALLRVKASIVDPLNVLESWTEYSKTAPCSWLGITCGPGSNPATSNSSAFVVVAVDLSSRNLSGSLSPDLGSLAELQSLNLAHNNFTGPIPRSISSCKSLKYLNLSDNAFSDDIPSAIFTDLAGLETLDLWINSLSGGIPRTIGAAPRLQHLDLGGNYLEGPIPEEIGNISTLRYLTLAGNSLVGGIPRELGQLLRLEWMYLGYNRLNGSIPAELGLLRESMVHLDIVFNELTGAIPGAAIANLTKLEYLFLYTNSLSGAIPDELGHSMERLVSLDLSNNSLTGGIPDSLARLPALEILNLFANNLTGRIPGAVAAMPRLKTLALWKNQLTGDVPSSLGAASNLTAVDLSSNFFTGPIPPSLCAGGGLFKLILFANAFTGPVPDGIARCRSLKRVRIQNNQLTGSVPAEMASLDQLYYLDLSQNRLRGSISELQWSAPALQILALDDNSLTGTIPGSIFLLPSLVELGLSRNRFTGPIPSEIGSAKTLSELRASDNQLSEEIPPEISACSRLVSINLARNRLAGPIPERLGAMATLGSLDLSGNELTGRIPASLGALESLEFLNVSMNKLSGPVPASASFEAVVNSSCLFGNAGLCATSPSNRQMLGLGPCPSKEATSSAFSWLIGIALSIGVAIAVAYSLCLLARHRRRQQQHVLPKFFKAELEAPAKPSSWHLILFHRLRAEGEEIVRGSSAEKRKNSDDSVVYYEAIDRDGLPFSVKRFNRQPMLSVETLKAVSRLRHENLAKVLGVCRGGDAELILFQHASNGCLASALFRAAGPESFPAGGEDPFASGEYSSVYSVPCLDWNKRYEIALGAAKGLAFLHKCTRPGKILHGSFSSESVFLDSNLHPRILLEPKQTDAAESKQEQDELAKCSGGHAAPELAYSKIITEKTDVYGFGITMLELLTGKRATDPSFSTNSSIVDWINKCISEKGWQAGTQFLDPAIVGNSPQTDAELMRVVKVAILCTKASPAERPAMHEVVKMLENARQNLPRSVQMMEIITK